MSNSKKGKLIVLVAPSGTGKSTIARRLLKDFKKIRFSVSATTRKPREGEKNGEAYFFLPPDEFETYVDQDKFLEWENYSNNKYGTLRSEVDKLLESGYFPLLDIEVKGAVNIQKQYGTDCISIFIQPPSLQVLRGRLVKRGTESEESLKARLDRAEKELKYAEKFNHVVINDDFDIAYKKVSEIIKSFISD